MRVLTEIVGHYCILVEGHESSSLGTGAETAHATRAEADVERARAEVSAVIASPKYTTEVWQTVNYAKAPPPLLSIHSSRRNACHLSVGGERIKVRRPNESRP